MHATETDPLYTASINTSDTSKSEGKPKVLLNSKLYLYIILCRTKIHPKTYDKLLNL